MCISTILQASFRQKVGFKKHSSLDTRFLPMAFLFLAETKIYVIIEDVESKREILTQSWSYQKK